MDGKNKLKEKIKNKKEAIEYENENFESKEAKSYLEIWEMLRQKIENRERVHLCGMGVRA